jgi:allantoinase
MARRFDLIIRNGKVITTDGVIDRDIGVDGDKIVELAPALSGNSTTTIDAKGLHVFPGLIDPHVHFNEPGRTDWEGFATGSSALAAGGGTLFFDMPLNSSPPVLDGASFDAKLRAAQASSFTDFALWGGLTPINLDKMEELAARGVVGFKAFMCDSGIDDFPYADKATLKAGMRIAAKVGLPVAVHAEDVSCLEQIRAAVTGHSWEDFLASRPKECETTAVLLAVAYAKEAGCSLHIVHVSHPFIVRQISRRRAAGADVTCETCPHYYLLHPVDLKTLGGLAKCAPPLRETARPWEWLPDLANGAIDFVASDHSPAPPSMKSGDDAFAVWGGIAGLQSTLSSLITIRRDMPIERVAELTATSAAERFGIPQKGRIEVGFDADFALVDIDAEYTLTREILLDRHKLSPYVGRQFKGIVRRTIVRGVTIFEDGRIIGSPRGRLVTPNRDLGRSAGA